MTESRLILVLGDQLTLDRGALQEADPGADIVLMAEVDAEATYVPHNRHKLVLIFSAMRHFRRELERAGFEVIYREITESVPSLTAALEQAVAATGAVSVLCCEPGEHRVRTDLEAWSADSGTPFKWVTDNHFLCSHADFSDWAKDRKQLRMEHFYRHMRKRHNILLDPQGQPEGGRWNYDRENRAGWRGRDSPPTPADCPPDAITASVIALVARRFPDNPGDLDHYRYGATREDAQARLDDFIEHCLPMFGRYQDAIAQDSPWLYHSLVSMYLNIGLLDPLEVCRAVESAWREARCDLAAAEGFIRQVLGWREFVRGVYWLHMPDYGKRNGLAAETPLPDWFWTGDTDLACLRQAITQSLELGYAHHIQRLMVIGNFALLTGLDVAQVCEWYLAVYVDAFEWVELPNTLGMALHGDGGVVGSKPYAASGKYIQRQGDLCPGCRYQPQLVTGDGACPYNSLYWAFLDRHEQRFSNNPRMALAMRNWRRKSASEQGAILQWARRELHRLTAPGKDVTG